MRLIVQRTEEGVEALKLEEIFLAYKKDVYKYLLSLTHHPDRAEELLSETFLKALQKLDTFSEKSTVKTWLFGIARNLWLQSLRKDRRELQFDDLLGLYVAEDALKGEIDGRELSARTQALLSQKSEKIRSVMTMRIHGYSQSEVAAACGISENSVRVIEFRTKKWLRENLEKEGFL